MQSALWQPEGTCSYPKLACLLSNLLVWRQHRSHRSSAMNGRLAHSECLHRDTPVSWHQTWVVNNNCKVAAASSLGSIESCQTSIACAQLPSLGQMLSSSSVTGATIGNDATQAWHGCGFGNDDWLRCVLHVLLSRKLCVALYRLFSFDKA